MTSDGPPPDSQPNPGTGTPLKAAILRWLLVVFLIYLLLLAIGCIGSGFNWAAGGKEGATQLFAFATNPVVALLVATLVQSSSTVTSIIVGLVAGGLPVGIAVPMIMGANMSTTVTALLASLGAPDHAQAAMQIALVHCLFNCFAVVLIYGLPPLRRLPLMAAERLAELGFRRKEVAIAWILTVFFVVPLIVIGTMKLFGAGGADIPSPAATPQPSADVEAPASEHWEATMFQLFRALLDSDKHSELLKQARDEFLEILDSADALLEQALPQLLAADASGELLEQARSVDKASNRLVRSIASCWSSTWPSPPTTPPPA